MIEYEDLIEELQRTFESYLDDGTVLSIDDDLTYLCTSLKEVMDKIKSLYNVHIPEMYWENLCTIKLLANYLYTEILLVD